jgi:hypothetical protein
MNTIKAIETLYRGYRCRSRLEARWLYFLDLIGIHYEYEPQGFCGGGIYYLPDIYIPAYHTFIEVKNESVYEDDELRAEARRKMEAVCGACLEYAGVIVYGDPLTSRCESYCFMSSEMCSGTDWVLVSFEYIRDNNASGAGICYNGAKLMRSYAGTMEYKGFENISNDIYRYVPDLIDLMLEAKFSARGARFEYGENPEQTVERESEIIRNRYLKCESIITI